jgi:hypothetical protein
MRATNRELSNATRAPNRGAALAHLCDDPAEFVAEKRLHGPLHAGDQRGTRNTRSPSQGQNKPDDEADGAREGNPDHWVSLEPGPSPSHAHATQATPLRSPQRRSGGRGRAG